MIDSYRFGEIAISGEVYTSDVIIFPQRVRSNWWRREGHKLYPQDIEEALRERPDVLVVGTGNSGMMVVPKETRETSLRWGLSSSVRPSTGRAIPITSFSNQRR